MASEDDKPVTLGDLKKMQAGNSTAPAAAAKTTDPGIIDKATTAFGKAAEAVTPLYFGFQKLTTGADAASTAVNAMATGVSAIGLPGLAGMSKDLAGAFLAQKTNMDKASAELGIGANNIGKFVRMSGEAGLTTEQFTESIRKTDGLMGGLAGSAQRGAEAFSKVQKTLIESNAGEALNAIGISGKELADMTALSMSNNTKLNLKTAAGQQQAAAAAAELAFELDATSKVTGASREKLMETLKADEKKTANILATNAMNDEQRAQYSAMKRTLAEFGAPMADLTTELATGGLRTKEGIAQMATLGDAGTKLQAAVQMQMKASSLAQKEAANRAMEEAKAAVNARMGSAQYKAMYDNGSAEFKAAIDKQVQGREGFQMQQKAIQEADGDALKARKNQMAEAKAMQSGQKVDADGKPIVGADGKAVADEGAKSAQMLNAVNRQATIQAGGMARAMETANAALGKSPAAINAFNTALGFVGKSKTMKEAEQGVYKAPGAVAGAAGVAGGPTEKPTSGTTGRKVEKVPAHGDGGIIKGPEVPAHGDGGIIKGPELAVIAEKGPEAVIPLDKLKEMMGNVSTTISGASGGDPESALSQIQSRLQDRLSKVADLQKLASERELSDKEKESLKHAEFGVKRAANNLADELARQTKIDEVVSVSKNKAVESKKDETTKISEVAKSSSSPANMLASMFSPTIINQKAAEAQKALTNSAPKTTDAAPKNTEEAKKKEAEDKAKAAEDAKNKEKAAATPGTVKASAGDATMKDLKDQLVTLNKNMLQLINHSEATADAAHKTAKSTAKATGAR